MPLRHRMLRLALAVLLSAAECLSAEVGKNAGVLVVTSSRIPAYEEAVEGLRSALVGTGTAITVVTLDLVEGKKLSGLLDAAKPGVLVAVGSAALEAISVSGHNCPIVATMVLAPAAGSNGGREIAATITLEVPPAAILTRLKHLYPDRKRIALVRGPALSAGSAGEIQAQARRLGYEVAIVYCPGPKELLDAIGSLHERSDFLWCLPDVALYQGPTVLALVLASIRNRIPLIGFSEGTVRAGALVGFYPDYRDVGVQTGESVLQRLEGQPLATRQHPRKVKAAVNDRVMRVLGFRFAPGGAAGLVILR